MTVTRGFTIIIASAFGFAIAGGVIGSTLGQVAPGYYCAVFAGREPGFDPVQVGVGLGITQGLIAGLVVGSIVVLSVVLSGPRRPEPSPGDSMGTRAPEPTSLGPAPGAEQLFSERRQVARAGSASAPSCADRPETRSLAAARDRATSGCATRAAPRSLSSAGRIARYCAIRTRSKDRLGRMPWGSRLLKINRSPAAVETLTTSNPDGSGAQGSRSAGWVLIHSSSVRNSSGTHWNPPISGSVSTSDKTPWTFDRQRNQRGIDIAVDEPSNSANPRGSADCGWRDRS